MEIKKLTSLTIETTNVCNFSCLICPTNNEMKREKGYMSFDLFQKTISGGKSLEHLCLHNWGEPTQNKDLFKMIKYAHDKGIRYTVFNTNGSLLDDDIINRILDSPLSIMRISVDGNPDTYKKIRGIDFQIIEKNILNLIKKRNEKNSSLKIGIVMVVEEQTEKDMDSFHNKWKAIGDHVRFQPKLIRSQRGQGATTTIRQGKPNWTVSKGKPPEGLRSRKTEIKSATAQSAKKTQFPKFAVQRTDLCPELFGKDYGKVVVLWDGKVVPCCADYEGELQIGDILNETVDSIWRGLAMRRLRKRHLDKDFPQICKNCDEYESQKVEKRFVI
tara:strand:+ start:8237 stop:9226 length:990 start_codon:yes stop_codon:yes gene_type:complete